MAVAGTVFTVGSAALLAAVLLSHLPGPARSWWAAAWLLPPAIVLEPVRDTLYFGQVNIVLMTLVTLDCLLRAPRWPRGALVGLAAAVKLTPAAFVLFFLLRRDLRAAATAAAAFLAATGAGFLLDWPGSVQYWTHYVFEARRIGSTTYASNQSILGLLTRAGLDPGTLAGAAAWLALAAVVVMAACRGRRRAFAACHAPWALSLNAFTALLISPISWSHHWVWCVPALLALAGASLRDHVRLPWATAMAGLFIFAAAPQLWQPSARQLELHWTAWQQALGNAYVLFAIAVLLLSACGPPAATGPGNGGSGAVTAGGGAVTVGSAGNADADNGGSGAVTVGGAGGANPVNGGRRRRNGGKHQ
jgi:alpha-1,2-mannosyltransferase